MSRLFLRKSIQDCEDDILERGGLRRSLNKWHLTALGVGATIGAGIFATTGTAIVGDPLRPGAGPAIVISFLLTALTCGFAALCYAEFAAMVPISGSAYTYAYASLGELVAWIIGWDLIIEYAVGNIGVAIGWSGYFRELLSHFGISLPAWLATDFRSAHMAAEAVAAGSASPSAQYLASALSNAPHVLGFPVIANLPAFLIVALITVVLVIGIRESANSNNAMVLLKIGIILFFCAVGATLVKPENWNNPALGGFAPNGWAGISAGAAIIFFSYIGFDATSTAAEEAKDPAKDMPFGIIMSLIVCTVLYIILALVMTGMAPWNQLGTPEPMITALALADGSPRLLSISRLIVSLGAVIAMSSVLLVFQLGQPRIFMSMSRDGLLPPFLSRVHRRFKTPYIGTIITGIFVATFAAFANIAEVVDLTNIGTLFAFVLVSAGVIVLRRLEPDRPRPFRAPLVPLTPIISIVACLYLMLQLPRLTWIRFGVWLLLGLLVYLFYGMRHSRLRLRAEQRER
ncbi:MAG TPA: amino acid permease [Gemmatimonadales bacterium]|jgi:APA family basic amino acid/polyamine antiporter|nr:amino acid permease [Gemmatimonadales bacterium]